MTGQQFFFPLFGTKSRNNKVQLISLVRLANAQEISEDAINELFGSCTIKSTFQGVDVVDPEGVKVGYIINLTERQEPRAHYLTSERVYADHKEACDVACGN